VIGRIVIDDPRPRTPGGHPGKGVIGEPLRISADIFRDGHDILAAKVQWRPVGDAKWRDVAMEPVVNDRWEALVEPSALGMHEFAIEAWTDRLATLAHDIEVKEAAGEPVDVERQEVELEQAAQRKGKKPADLTRSETLPLWVDRERAQVGAWYELFPRSEGGFRRAAQARLPDVAAMGFDVVYLPPIHPIGRSHRKGPNNTLHASATDPGSPWAIGNELGGHTAVEPSLGTVEDFDFFVAAADKLGLEVALDYALQCSPDHPWVSEHPEWFHQRPDGTIKYAENPPKKYQDIYPINFWPAKDADRAALWQACKDILDHWIGHGIRIFRVDNPHTKPLAFWEWLIPAIQRDHPETLFLAEAFTRPKMMAKLAEVGFSQSYTYFTWRNGRDELREYLEELTEGPTAVGPAAERAALGLPAPAHAGRHHGPHLWDVQRLRAVREPAGVAGQRGVLELREVRGQAPGLAAHRLAGPLRHPPQRRPPPPPRLCPAAQRGLPHVQLRPDPGVVESDR